MHIAFIVTRSDSIGGAQIHVRDMALRLLVDRHKVSVLTGSEGPLTDILRDAGVEVRILSHLVRPMHPLKDFLAILEAQGHLKELEPDIVSTHTAKAGLVGRLAAWRLGIPSIFTAHGWQFAEGISWFQRIVVESLERFTAKICSKIITVSEYDRELALRRKVVPPEKMITIHNGMPDVPGELVRWLSHEGNGFTGLRRTVQSMTGEAAAKEPLESLANPEVRPPLLSPTPEESPTPEPPFSPAISETSSDSHPDASQPNSSQPDASRPFQDPHLSRSPHPAQAADAPVQLIMVARLQPQKDHPTLFRALANLRDRNWTLELVGDGPDREALQALAKELGISDRVIFAGQRLDVPERLRCADVFVLATRWEGFPRSILEGMRAGLPVVATDVGGCRESVVDGETGFLVRKEDPVELRDKLLQLIDSPELRARMGRNGRKRFEENFTFERMYERTLEVYRSVIGSSGNR